MHKLAINFDLDGNGTTLVKKDSGVPCSSNAIGSSTWRDGQVSEKAKFKLDKSHFMC